MTDDPKHVLIITIGYRNIGILLPILKDFCIHDPVRENNTNTVTPSVNSNSDCVRLRSVSVTGSWSRGRCAPPLCPPAQARVHFTSPRPLIGSQMTRAPPPSGLIGQHALWPVALGFRARTRRFFNRQVGLCDDHC